MYTGHFVGFVMLRLKFNSIFVDFMQGWGRGGSMILECLCPPTEGEGNILFLVQIPLVLASA